MQNKFILGLLVALNPYINDGFTSYLYNYLNKIYQCLTHTIPITHTTILPTIQGIITHTLTPTPMRLSGDPGFKPKLPNQESGDQESRQTSQPKALWEDPEFKQV